MGGLRNGGGGAEFDESRGKAERAGLAGGSAARGIGDRNCGSPRQSRETDGQGRRKGRETMKRAVGKGGLLVSLHICQRKKLANCRAKQNCWGSCSGLRWCVEGAHGWWCLSCLPLRPGATRGEARRLNHRPPRARPGPSLVPPPPEDNRRGGTVIRRGVRVCDGVADGLNEGTGKLMAPFSALDSFLCGLGRRLFKAETSMGRRTVLSCHVKQPKELISQVRQLPAGAAETLGRKLGGR